MLIGLIIKIITKKLLIVLLLIHFTALYSQTAITDANLTTAINACLTLNPVDGMFTSSEFAAMPNWDVSAVTDMDKAFEEKFVFNANISAWNTSNVISMEAMFKYALAFNQNISAWNTSNVKNMRDVFTAANNCNRNSYVSINASIVSSSNFVKLVWNDFVSFEPEPEDLDVSGIWEWCSPQNFEATDKNSTFKNITKEK